MFKNTNRKMAILMGANQFVKFEDGQFRSLLDNQPISDFVPVAQVELANTGFCPVLLQTRSGQALLTFQQEGWIYQTILTSEDVKSENIDFFLVLYEGQFREPKIFLDRVRQHRRYTLNDYENTENFMVRDNQVHYQAFNGRFGREDDGRIEDITPCRMYDYWTNENSTYFLERLDGFQIVSYDKYGYLETSESQGHKMYLNYRQISFPQSAIPVQDRLPMRPMRKNRIAEKYLSKTLQEGLSGYISKLSDHDIRFLFEWDSLQLPVLYSENEHFTDFTDLAGNPRQVSDPVELSLDPYDSAQGFLVRTGQTVFLLNSQKQVVDQQQVSDIPIDSNWVYSFSTENPDRGELTLMNEIPDPDLVVRTQAFGPTALELTLRDRRRIFVPGQFEES
jgi:hypothetical protein